MKALWTAVLAATLTAGTAFDLLGQIGKLDPSFAAGGIFPFKTTEATGLANGVVIQNDGKIVFSSSATSTSLGWTPGYRMVVARLTDHGLPDPSFGGGLGYVTPMMVGTANIYEPVVAMQPDPTIPNKPAVTHIKHPFETVEAAPPEQKIICGGWTVPLGGEMGDFILTRLNPDGTEDPSFISVPVNIAGHDIAESIAILPGGAIIQVGFSYQQYPELSSSSVSAVKYLPNGGLDPSFGSGGKMTYYFPPRPRWIGHAVVAQPDGKMVIGGYGVDVTGSSYTLLAMRILPNGSLDPTFSAPDGWFTLDGFTGYTNPAAFSLALQGDGKIILAGEAQKTAAPNDYDALAVRLTPAGELDFIFGPATLFGMTTIDCGGGEESIRGIVVDHANHYILVGRSITPTPKVANWLVICLEDIFGDLVPAFDPTGSGKGYGLYSNNLFHAVAVDQLNRIVAVGDEINSSGNVIKAARFTNFVDAFAPNPEAISLSVFPNPAEDVLHLQYTAPDAGDARYQIFDVTGKMVWERAENDQAAGPRQTELHLDQQMPPGLYWLNVQMGQASGTAKFIKL